jgi:DNA-binding MarR family transcriptional regulator
VDHRGDAERQRAASATLRASRALVGVIARSLAPVLDQISLAQFRVLVILAERGPTRSGLIAEHLGVHPSTFTRMADRLVAAGWVERQEAAGNRREVHIALAAPGRELVEDVTLRRLKAIEEILDPLTPAKRRAIEDGLQTFAEAAGEPGLDDLAVLGF